MRAVGIDRERKPIPIWLKRGDIVRLLRQLETRAVDHRDYQEVAESVELAQEIYRQAKAAGYSRGSLQYEVLLPLEGGSIGGGA
jgi:hypothetical protein